MATRAKTTAAVTTKMGTWRLAGAWCGAVAGAAFVVVASINCGHASAGASAANVHKGYPSSGTSTPAPPTAAAPPQAIAGAQSAPPPATASPSSSAVVVTTTAGPPPLEQQQQQPALVPLQPERGTRAEAVPVPLQPERGTRAQSVPVPLQPERGTRAQPVPLQPERSRRARPLYDAPMPLAQPRSETRADPQLHSEPSSTTRRLRFSVHGVDRADVLNVRSEPSPKSPVVGEIPPEATNVVATGGRRQMGTSVWREVTYGSVRGWVNERFLVEERDGASPTPAEPPEDR